MAFRGISFAAVARDRGRPIRGGMPPTDPTETVRIPRSLLRRVRRLAAHADVAVPDYLASLLTPLVDAAEAKMVKDIQAERKKPAE